MNQEELRSGSGALRCLIEKLDIADISRTFLTLNSGFSVVDTSTALYKQGGHIFGVLTIKSDADIPQSQVNIGSINYNIYRPMNYGCVLGTTEWTSSEIGYVYIGTNKSILITAQSAGKKYAKIMVSIHVK